MKKTLARLALSSLTALGLAGGSGCNLSNEDIARLVEAGDTLYQINYAERALENSGNQVYYIQTRESQQQRQQVQRDETLYYFTSYGYYGDLNSNGICDLYDFSGPTHEFSSSEVFHFYLSYNGAKPKAEFSYRIENGRKKGLTKWFNESIPNDGQYYNSVNFNSQRLFRGEGDYVIHIKRGSTSTFWPIKIE